MVLSRKALEIQCQGLENDLEEALSAVVVSARAAMKPMGLRWLADQFDRWHASGLGLFTIATVQQFESGVGRLAAHRHLELPPYAEVLLQPGNQAAFRHPEYMLVRDLGLLFDLYTDAELLCDSINMSHPPQWAIAAGESTQSLARAVIQTCFNLLESYVSGLARAHIMSHGGVDARTTEKLLGTREPLRTRVRQVPALIVGRECPLTLDEYPLKPLFLDVGLRRAAGGGGEPGQLRSERGYVKEAVFHDLPRDLVPLAIRATHDTIRHLWAFVHDKDGPRWLPSLEPSGRFGKRDLRLSPRLEPL
jgi:hypothetical protein